MHYCVSDIHGEYDRYIKMLNKIKFSSTDILFVIGDVVDRGGHGIDVLMDIMSRPNVKMILGNHELLMLDAMFFKEISMYRERWIYNGGAKTRRYMLHHLTASQRERVLRFCNELPDHLDIEVAGRRFHLVHGYPSAKTEDRVWERPMKGSGAPLPGKIVILGHTPTPYLMDVGDTEPFTIWHGDGIIGIDCGCGSRTKRRRLACIRLEDMKEFYV